MSDERCTLLAYWLSREIKKRWRTQALRNLAIRIKDFVHEWRFTDRLLHTNHFSSISPDVTTLAIVGHWGWLSIVPPLE
ncbi:hypothetical protein BJX66DRAFT_317681 [Aspergillus keveii]|uniref:Uncharacterized protein n=1 Tax=Aspergillus keveii TaxID=714993 RepID=A0ABR4FKV8_9EURO